jgi:hypothetical protein
VLLQHVLLLLLLLLCPLQNNSRNCAKGQGSMPAAGCLASQQTPSLVCKHTRIGNVFDVI